MNRASVPRSVILSLLALAPSASAFAAGRQSIKGFSDARVSSAVAERRLLSNESVTSARAYVTGGDGLQALAKTSPGGKSVTVLLRGQTKADGKWSEVSIYADVPGTKENSFGHKLEQIVAPDGAGVEEINRRGGSTGQVVELPGGEKALKYTFNPRS